MKLSEKLAGRFREKILENQWKLGERIPPERDLAEEYRAGRPAVREALGQLILQGLLKTSPQSCSYVTDFRNETSLELLYYLIENNYRRTTKPTHEFWNSGKIYNWEPWEGA